MTEYYVTTDGQSASLSSNKAPICGLRPDLHYCQTVAGLLMWGALSDRRTVVVYKCCWPRQRSQSRARVPWDSWTYCTVSDSRLPFSSPSTTRRATVEVFDPASTRALWICQSQSYVTTDGQSAIVSWYEAPMWGLRPDIYFCQIIAGLLTCGALSDERTGLSFARVTVSSNKSAVRIYNLHFTCY
jgi:hypothetical protein